MPTTFDRLKTVVRNGTGENGRHFSYLPPHGKTLDADEDFVWNGDLTGYMAEDPRRYAAWEEDLEGGNLILIQTPTVSQYDTTAARVRQLNLDNSTATSQDPPEGSYVGPAPTF